MSDLEEGECEEMDEEEDLDSNEDEDDDEEGEESAGNLFDALAAAQEAAERYRELEKSKINESCKLPDDFLITAFKTATRWGLRLLLIYYRSLLLV